MPLEVASNSNTLAIIFGGVTCLHNAPRMESKELGPSWWNQMNWNISTVYAIRMTLMLG